MASMTIETISTALTEARNSVAAIVAAIEQTDDLDALVAVQKRTAVMRADVLVVEMTVLSKIARLGYADDLPPHLRPTARWCGELTADTIRRWADNPDLPRTAKQAYRLASEQGWNERLREEGQLTARREVERRTWKDGEPGAPPPSLTDALAAATDYDGPHDLTAAIETIIAVASDAFTIDEMTTSVLAEYALPPGDEDPFREGIREVCRSAVRRAPLVTICGFDAPRFITAKSGAEFIRIPIENAVLADVRDMAALRRNQLQEDTARLVSLERFYDGVIAMGATEGVRLGEVEFTAPEALSRPCPSCGAPVGRWCVTYGDGRSGQPGRDAAYLHDAR